MSNQKVALLILDGWGIGDQSSSDAIYHAKTPFIDSLYKNYPNAQLRTDGEFVGLPDGQMGNSEVGHLNIGAGRVIFQDLVKINKAVDDNSISDNIVLKEALNYAKTENKKVHLMGLVSDGGIHSHSKHLYKLIDIAEANGLKDVFVHAFTDGRDCKPTSGIDHITKLMNKLEGSNAKLASMIGRYYAMDRDNRWERIKIAYDLLTSGIGAKSKDPIGAIQDSYEEGITDEFLKPVVFTNSEDEPIARIERDDVVICFNYRTDRCREITYALTQNDLPEHGMISIPLHYVTMTNYDSSFNQIKILYDKDNLKNTLGEVISHAQKKQIRIAETEKYPHVTFFFSGGQEVPFEGESRIMIPSPKVGTYDQQPEMSAAGIAENIINEIQKESADFICLNFANPDMVGHTGVFDAIVKAVETVDGLTQKIVEEGLRHDYSFVIIADHGNADFAVNPDGSPNTAHSTNPVPVFLIDKNYTQIRNGILADVAPTILKIMGIECPAEMTGKILIN
jgi:2,3-bisphosphoglycerate-independent phosphoglycerate mutase